MTPELKGETFLKAIIFFGIYVGFRGEVFKGLEITVISWKWEVDFFLLNGFGPVKTAIVFSKGLCHQQFHGTISSWWFQPI